MMSTIIRYLAIAFLIVMLAYLMQACSVQPAGETAADSCEAHSDSAQLQAAGCERAAYVVQCTEPTSNPGLAGQCTPPATGALGIKRELAGKSAVWCCE